MFDPQDFAKKAVESGMHVALAAMVAESSAAIYNGCRNSGVPEDKAWHLTIVVVNKLSDLLHEGMRLAAAQEKGKRR